MHTTGHRDRDQLSSPDAMLARRLAIPMFCLSLIFLALLAGLTVVWVDMATPDLQSLNVTDGSATEGGLVVQSIGLSKDRLEVFPKDLPDQSLAFIRDSAIGTGYLLFAILLAIWPCFLVEPLVCRCYRRRQTPNDSLRDNTGSWSSDFWPAICPPLRLAKPIAAMGGEIWLPRIDWHPPGKPLAKLLEKVFSKPMLIIAMLILPILLIEFGLSKQVQSMPALKLTLSICTGLIWCAFAIEFIVMVSATDKKLAYVKKNWIDLAIILLPLVSFLRSLRIVRTANIAKFAKVQQLTKMSRVYRMRGLVAKSIRALMVLEVVHRVFKITPEKRIERLTLKLAELEEDADEIRQQIKQLQSPSVESELSLSPPRLKPPSSTAPSSPVKPMQSAAK